MEYGCILTAQLSDAAIAAIIHYAARYEARFFQIHTNIAPYYQYFFD